MTVNEQSESRSLCYIPSGWCNDYRDHLRHGPSWVQCLIGITEDDAINNIVFHLSLLLLSSYLISVSMLLHQIVNS